MRPWKEIKSEIRTKYRRQREDAEVIRETSLCFHPENRLEYRRRMIANGRFQLRKQCMHCGEVVAGAISYSEVADVNATLFVDESLEQQSRNLQRVDNSLIAENEASEISTAFWEYYKEYMSSEQWFDIRNRVMGRAHGKCEGCGIRSAAHVHHTTYEHLGDEMLFELLALCRNCHEKIHEKEIA